MSLLDTLSNVVSIHLGICVHQALLQSSWTLYGLIAQKFLFRPPRSLHLYAYTYAKVLYLSYEAMRAFHN